MNESEIENLLRKAPRPTAPAGLKEQLEAEIQLPPANHGRTSQPAFALPFWKRWIPALSFGVLLIGCLVILGVQANQLLELRRENVALRAATKDLDERVRENAELRRLQTAVLQAERAKKEQEELNQLRNEVSRIRGAAQQLAVARAEAERLQAERVAAAAKAGVPMEEDPFAEAKARADRIACINNIKQIGLAARLWANDNKETFPNDFLSMSNELNTPKILTCPGDTARKKASSWQEFDGSSVSYEFLSPGATEGDPAVVLVRCPIHFNVGLADGSAQQLNPTNTAIEQVDGKFKIVRKNSSQP